MKLQQLTESETTFINKEHRSDSAKAKAMKSSIDSYDKESDLLLDKIIVVKKQPIIDGVNWQEYYTLTEEEYKEWYHWCLDMLEEKFPQIHPEMIKTKFLFEYASIYGLKTV